MSSGPVLVDWLHKAVSLTSLVFLTTQSNAASLQQTCFGAMLAFFASTISHLTVSHTCFFCGPAIDPSNDTFSFTLAARIQNISGQFFGLFLPYENASAC